MMLSQLSATAPLPLRLAAWAQERFPLALCGVLFPAYLVALLYGRALTHPGPPRLRAGDLVAFAGVWAFFLMVRVVDEHKDYERDRVEHPGRVLQRGVVALGHLKGVAGAALLVQVVVVLATGSGLWWALTIAWASAAAVDFFLGPRIEGRPVLYPLLHLPLSGLVCVWMAQLGAERRGLPPTAFAIAAAGVALAGSVDLVRKLVPVDGAGRAYAVALGAHRTAWAGAVAVAVDTTVLVALVQLGSGWLPAVAILPALAVGPLALLYRFATTGEPAPARTALAVLLPVQLMVCAAALLAGAGGW